MDLTMARNIKPNYDETLAELRTVLETCMPRGGQLYGKLGHYSTVEFRRGDMTCSLYVRLDSQYGRYDYETDARGDEYSTDVLQFEVNYPCYGSGNPAVTLAHIGLVEEVARFACELEARFGNRRVVRLVHTAEERAEYIEQQAKLTDQSLANKLVQDHCKGWRKGKSEGGFIADEKLRSGKYDVTMQGRTYVVDVNGMLHIADITRTS